MTKKQMGDAGEMLVAAEMTLAGVPAMKVPDNWPGYDVVAQPPDGGPAQRISVKTRTRKAKERITVEYLDSDVFDWLAIVFLFGTGPAARRIFIVPRKKADATAKAFKPTAKYAGVRYWSEKDVADIFPEFENNFCLSPTGRCDTSLPTDTGA